MDDDLDSELGSSRFIESGSLSKRTRWFHGFTFAQTQSIGVNGWCVRHRTPLNTVLSVFLVIYKCLVVENLFSA